MTGRAGLEQALSELDPEARALLELSLRRGIPDDELAELLGTTEPAVHRRREVVLRELAESLGEPPGSAVAERVAEHLARSGNLFAARQSAGGGELQDRPGAAAAAKSEAASPPKAGAGAAPSSSQRRLLFSVAGGALIGLVVLLVLGFGVDGEEPAPRSEGADEPRRPRTAQLGPEAELERLPGAPRRARGTARLIERAGRTRLELRVRGLPDPEGQYGVWLYSSAQDARQLGRFPSADIRLDAPLPPDSSRFASLDVSVERDRADPGHSGVSVLRVPLARLRP